MGNIDGNRARLLIQLALGQSIQSGGLPRASDGKVWVLAIHADPDGTVRAVRNEDDYDTINQLLGGQLSEDEWARWTKPGPTVWVLSLFCEGGWVYAEASEVMLWHELDARRCLFFDGDYTQCGKPATFVCLNSDGLQWFACSSHADAHRFVRMPLARFQHLARTGQTATSFWEPGPSSSDEACAWVRHIGQCNGISWPTGGEQEPAGLGSTKGKAHDA